MAARGPVPKRSDQRRRQNIGDPITSIASAPVVEVPAADESWHPIARRWFESLGKSGQAVFYQPSDWAHAEFVAEAMSRNLVGEKFSAVLFASVLSGMTDLLTTEGSRRRARLEIEAANGEPVAPVIDYRARFTSAGA